MVRGVVLQRRRLGIKLCREGGNIPRRGYGYGAAICHRSRQASELRQIRNEICLL